MVNKQDLKFCEVTPPVGSSPTPGTNLSNEFKLSISNLYGPYHKIYGPYKSKKDGRLRCLIYKKTNKGLKKLTKSYPKLCMEVKLGRLLGPYEEVDHKDGNPKNNKEYNFQILSTKENLKKQKLEGKCFLIPNRYGEQNSRSFLTNEDIIFIRKNNNIMSRKELATKFNIHKTTVGLIINRKRWNHI